jgi:O-antigen/teichoic acid export membrane protein
VSQPLRIHSGLLARNAALNLAGNMLPLAAALVCMPLLIERLDAARFGLLALAWALLGYLTVFDFGISRAATKYVAEEFSRGNAERAAAIGWTCIAVQALFGALATAVLLLVAPWLVYSVLKMDAALTAEALRILRLLAWSIPFILIYNSFRGILEAAQRFDYVNYVRAPFNAANFAIPAAGVLVGWDLPAIIAALLFSRVLAVLIQYALCARALPALRRRPRLESAFAYTLLRFGGWVTISGIVSPLLVYFDRFAIGALVSLAAVGFYSVPFEVATRMLFIPASLVTTLFPAFSSLLANGEGVRAQAIFATSIRFLLVALAVPMTLIAVFSYDILALWVGIETAQMSAGVLRILAIGIIFNSLALVPLSYLQGVGRPDIAAKFHLVELPLHVGLVVLFVGGWGVTGAALAWTVRVAIDAVLLVGAAAWVGGMPKSIFVGPQMQRALGVIAVVAAAAALALLAPTVLTRALGGGAALVVGVALAWAFVLDATERAGLASAARGARSRFAPGT